MKLYRKRGAQPMEPWAPGYDMEGVSISPEDAAAGSPKEGGMIAQNAKNPADKWLVAGAFFRDNYEPAESE